MRWRDVAATLESQPGYREAFEQQFPYANAALAVVALRARHALTQRALAERVGTPQPVIARLESGRHPVEIKLLARIADAVGETWAVSFAPTIDGAAPDGTQDVAGADDALLDGDMTPIRVKVVAVDDQRIEFRLSDGRAISAPVEWSRRLVAASAAERADYSISPSGTVVEWPSIDEHIALWSMLRVPEQVVLDAAGFERASGPASA